MIFNYCPDCGSACTKMGGKTFVCSSCGHNFYNEPAVCAGVLVKNQDNKYLFQVRNVEPGKDMLGLPGGFVDNDEKLEDTLARECHEEAKINLNNIKYFGSYPKYNKIAGQIISIIFTAETTDSGVADGVETSEIYWLGNDQIDLNKIGLEDQRDFLNDYFKIF